MRALLRVGCVVGLSRVATADEIQLGDPTVSGSMKDKIRETVARHAAKLQDCYDTQRLSAAGLGGRLSVAFTIEPTGTVSASAPVGVGGAPTLAVGRCMAAVIKAIAFDKPATKTTVDYPIEFRAGDEGVATGGRDADLVMVMRVLRRERARLVACYERELQKQPGLGGTVTAKFAIGATGKVSRVTASGVDSSVSTCIATELEAVAFDKPSEPSEVSYPFVFRAPGGVAIGGGDADKMMVRRHIKRAIAKIQDCYEKQLEKSPGLAGTVNVRFILDGSGKVTESTGVGVDPAVAKCVAAVVRGIAFDKPSTAPLVINYPFVFRRASS